MPTIAKSHRSKRRHLTVGYTNLIAAGRYAGWSVLTFGGYGSAFYYVTLKRHAIRLRYSRESHGAAGHAHPRQIPWPLVLETSEGCCVLFSFFLVYVKKPATNHPPYPCNCCSQRWPNHSLQRSCRPQCLSRKLPIVSGSSPQCRTRWKRHRWNCHPSVGAGWTSNNFILVRPPTFLQPSSRLYWSQMKVSPKFWTCFQHLNFQIGYATLFGVLFSLVPRRFYTS